MIQNAPAGEKFFRLEPGRILAHSEGGMEASTYIVEKLVHGGLGLVRDGASVILVPDVLPGERVRLRIVAGPRKALRAEAVEIVEPSPARVAPVCALFGRCGGCRLQHASYAAQLAFKPAVLAEDLARLAGISLGLDPIIPAPAPFHYRSRVRLHYQRGRFGFFGEDRKDFWPVKHCWLAAEALNDSLRALPALVRRTRGLREAELIAHDDAVYAVTNPGRGERTYRRTDDASGWRETDRRLAFEQVNPGQNQALRRLVAEHCRRLAPELALELYAGAGNLTAAAAAHCGRVLAVDSDPDAAALAAEMFAPEGGRVRFQCLRAEEFVERALADGLTPDLIILDPPRTGAREIMAGIARLAPRAILYISCEPATLARDLKALAPAGYRPISIIPIDMFPQTAHLECVVLVERR
jgi:23S rRNA (uracil1939-C5)-methyltransferase